MTEEQIKERKEGLSVVVFTMVVNGTRRFRAALFPASDRQTLIKKIKAGSHRLGLFGDDDALTADEAVAKATRTIKERER